MENSFRFFNNSKCRYYPCHKVDSPDGKFNCLFCYCPLYLIETCGGNYKKTNGVKDCSNCLIPHRFEGYDYINKILREKVYKKD